MQDIYKFFKQGILHSLTHMLVSYMKTISSWREMTKRFLDNSLAPLRSHQMSRCRILLIYALINLRICWCPLYVFTHLWAYNLFFWARRKTGWCVLHAATYFPSSLYEGSGHQLGSHLCCDLFRNAGLFILS